MSSPFHSPLIHLVVSTNVPGAFTSPPPPDEFDINAATPSTLAKHGIYWRKAKPGDPPVKAEAWNHHLGVGWSAAKRIIPQLVPIRGKTHLPVPEFPGAAGQ